MEESSASDPLDSLGWDSDWASALSRAGAGGGQPARVTAQHRSRWMVHSKSGSHPARVPGSGSPDFRPVTGDWVLCDPGPHPSDPWSIVSILPRRTAVRRGSAGESSSEQVLAANIDRLWIVQSLEKDPNLRSLERYLAVAWDSGATPEIVLTKADLAEDVQAALGQVGTIAFGVRVHVVSVEETGRLDALLDGLAPGQTIALLGPSGAGKSTLINALADKDLAETGEVRPGDRKGRHTTTTRELFVIPGGAIFLDTPGMRELKVLDLDVGLDHAFPEVDELSDECHFRDCTHTSEPGCAVLAAEKEGRLDPERLASFRKLEAEAAYQKRKTDPQAQAEHVREWKTAFRTLKHHPKHKDRR